MPLADIDQNKLGQCIAGASVGFGGSWLGCAGAFGCLGQGCCAVAFVPMSVSRAANQQQHNYKQQHLSKRMTPVPGSLIMRMAHLFIIPLYEPCNDKHKG